MLPALAQLSHAAYPLLAETARHARPITPDDEFRLGLTAVLHGLRTEASQHDGTGPG